MRYFVSILLVVLTVPSLAQADLPKRKPGLWEIKMTSDAGHGGGPMVSQHCIDAKTDDLLQQRTQEMGKQECSKNTVRKEGGKTIAGIGVQVRRHDHDDARGFQRRFLVQLPRRDSFHLQPADDGHEGGALDHRGQVARRLQGRPEARRRHHARHARWR